MGVDACMVCWPPSVLSRASHGIRTSLLEFGNVHQFGKRSNDRPRPIVARFLYHKDLRLVLDRTKWPKNTPFGIHEQFPNAIEERRKKGARYQIQYDVLS
jgi:hypothetical protein